MVLTMIAKTATFFLLVMLCVLMFSDVEATSCCDSSAPTGVAWFNHWRAYLYFSCPSGYSLRQWRSVHRNCKEDRLHSFKCDEVPVTGYRGHCRWTSQYVNSYDGPVDFKCTHNAFITGIQSYYSDHHQDRRFNFRCCDVGAGYSRRNCKMTPYINDWDQPINYEVEKNFFMVGVHSYHHSYYEDRRWRFEICEIKK